jgi:hypothetical protein
MKSLTVLQLVKVFTSCTLPKHEWTHHAHFKVGLWYLLHYSPSDSIEKLRQDIKQYNVACGVENTDSQGYHETISQFYIWLIDKFVRQVDRSQSIDLLADELIDLYGDKLMPFRYYSYDRLMSKTARVEWVEPDLIPLD